jgi:hypothetical protein
MNAQVASWVWRLAYPQSQTVSQETYVSNKVESRGKTGGTHAPSTPFLPRLLGFLRDEADRLALDHIRRVVESGWRIACAPPFAFTRPS